MRAKHTLGFTLWKNANGTGHDAYLDTAAKGAGLTIVLCHKSGSRHLPDSPRCDIDRSPGLC